MKNDGIGKYAFEFLSIFIAVISAFALNNWNDNRRDKIAEQKILTEIYNGLEKDIVDTKTNAKGHEAGLNAVKFWRKVLNDEKPILDSIGYHYFTLTRDFTSILNTSGYETLKSKGFELLQNDTLRKKIITLYEINYQSLRKIEEDYFESQFHRNYFKEFNEAVAPNFVFNAKGHIASFQLPLDIDDKQKKKLLTYLIKIEYNRFFILRFYNDVEQKIEALKIDIQKELDDF